MKLIEGIIKKGVRIGYFGPRRCLIREAHPTAYANPQLLDEDIDKQPFKHRLITLPSRPAEHYIASPLGLVPKQDGGWRCIHDLSHPKGRSVNDHIPENFGALEYATFEQALSAVIELGAGCYLHQQIRIRPGARRDAPGGLGGLIPSWAGR